MCRSGGGAAAEGGAAAVEGGAAAGGGDNEEGASAGRRECREERLCDSEEEEDGGQEREESERLEAEEGGWQVFQGIKEGDVVHAVWDMREGVLEFALNGFNGFNGFPHPQRMRLSGVSAEAAAGGQQQVSPLMCVAVCTCGL